ncbi:MAG TPA: twin-arginine translocation signal domain-containing protein, partial [Pseudomonas sp.]|nr:twin-arginine translocation signal domain-containing protein [Pseudomonas sp.]
MLIQLPPRSQCQPSEITPEAVYLSRRRFLGAAGVALGAAALPAWARADGADYAGVEPGNPPPWFTEKLPTTRWRAVAAPGEA